MFTSTLLAPEAGSNCLDDRGSPRPLPFLEGFECRPPRGESGGNGPLGARLGPGGSGLGLRYDPVSDEVGGRLCLTEGLRGLRGLRGRDLDRRRDWAGGESYRCLGDLLLLWRYRPSECGGGLRASRGERDLRRRGGLRDLERAGRVLCLRLLSWGGGERGRCGTGDGPRWFLGGTALSRLSGLTSGRGRFGRESRPNGGLGLRWRLTGAGDRDARRRR